MDWLIIFGTIVSILGLIGLVFSALRVVKAKRAGLTDDALKAAVQSAMAWNMGALMLSALGLMMVIVAVILA